MIHLPLMDATTPGVLSCVEGRNLTRTAYPDTANWHTPRILPILQIPPPPMV
jgi:hypothetical protein